jgi:hypothetical protein
MPFGAMTQAEKHLQRVLRIGGLGLLAALTGAFMPRPWMAQLHEMLDLGPFPAQPIVVYLARSTSGLYAFMGGLLWLLARDVRRNHLLINYVGVMGLIASAGLFVTDIRIHMPLYWILVEGPVVAILSGSLLVLSHLARKAERQPARPDPVEADA